jgi:hypothetical protein
MVKRYSREEIQTLEDLEDFLGEPKLTELFIQHYLKNVGINLEVSDELKDIL